MEPRSSHTKTEALVAECGQLRCTLAELETTNRALEATNQVFSSTNDELQAINEELGDRAAGLAQRNAYLASALASVEVSVLLVDPALVIRMWTGLSCERWGLRAADVVDRPLCSLNIGLPITALEGAIRRALSGRPDRDPIAIDGHPVEDQPVRCHVRVQPLRGVAQRIDGAVILISEIGGGTPAAHRR